MPKLTHACLVTWDVGRLRAFYREVFGVEPKDAGPQPGEYFEFALDGAILTLWAGQAAERELPVRAPGAAAHQTAMLEFQIGDADAEYARLRQHPQLTIDWLK